MITQNNTLRSAFIVSSLLLALSACSTNYKKPTASNADSVPKERINPEPAITNTIDNLNRNVGNTTSVILQAR